MTTTTSDYLLDLVNEAIEIAKDQGIDQRTLSARSQVSVSQLSRLKKANDAHFSTLKALGAVIGKKTHLGR